MNDKTLAAVEALAKHLNTTAEHLWGVLVAQAQISAIINAVVLLAMWRVIITYLLNLKKLLKLCEEENLRYTDPVWHPIMLYGGGILSAALMLYQFAVLRELLTCILNPEYYALQQILKAL